MGVKDFFTWKSTINDLSSKNSDLSRNNEALLAIGDLKNEEIAFLKTEVALLNSSNSLLSNYKEEIDSSISFVTDDSCRVTRVKESLLADESLVKGRPFIEGGTYNWLNIDVPVYLDFLFPDIPLAMFVVPDTKNFRGCQLHDDASCKKRVQDTAYLSVVCERAGVPLIVIEPDESVGVFDIHVKVKEALGIKER